MSSDPIYQYFPELPSLAHDKFERLGPLFAEWNAQINLVSRKDIEELYTRHVLHSLSIAKFLSFQPGTCILDVGTGGGFPGIPLAILYPDCHFHLVDSIGKKIMVVADLVEKLNLTNVTTEVQRAEKLKQKFDFVVTRAVAPSKVLWQWTQQLISSGGTHEWSNGIIALKGGDLQDELKELKKPYQIFHLRDHFPEPFFDTKKIVYIPR